MLKITPSSRVEYLKITLAALFMTLVVHLLEGILKRSFFDILIGIWIVGLLVCILSHIVNYFRSLEITEEDIIFKVGVLNVRSVVVPYEQITNINVKRNLFDRIVQLGTLEIDTSGTHGTEIVMEHIPKKKLEEAVDIIRERRTSVIKKGKDDSKK